MIIDGLNEQQCKMLDNIWACDTDTELYAYKASLSSKQKKEFDILLQMLIEAHIEEELEGDVCLGKSMLEGIGVNCG
jgi:hypothetical protein